MVTHKLNLFGQCESIVGVTRPPQQFSKVYSLRLKSSQGQYYNVWVTLSNNFLKKGINMPISK